MEDDPYCLVVVVVDKGSLGAQGMDDGPGWVECVIGWLGSRGNGIIIQEVSKWNICTGFEKDYGRHQVSDRILTLD